MEKFMLFGGLQKWVGWKEGDQCCLGQTKGGNSEGIGKGCERSGANCCGNGNNSHECSTKCGTSATEAGQKCYLSAYCKSTTQPSSSSAPENYLWPTISNDPSKVHLLARIFLGSVCLIWSGLSQLGWLTKGGSSGNNKRWSDSSLHEITGAGKDGLGSFMAAMGYDLERLNQGGGAGKAGTFVNGLLKGSGAKGIQWKEFTGDSTGKDSVAEYYSSIYGAAQSAAKGSAKSTESICKDYPLLVLHILASGYFRAGSAGAKGITSPKPGSSPTGASDPTKKDNAPRKPKTIREILYWLSALPYSEGYRALVERMKGKMDGILPKEEQDKGELKLHSESTKASTTLKRDCITHYLMAACGYCPLVLIGIQGTIEREVKTEAQPAVPGVPGVGVPGAVSPAAAAKAADDKRCPEHKKNPSAKRCNPKDIKEPGQAVAPAAPAAPTGEPLKDGQVCYGGYHLEVSKFGPLHGMYANGLFGFHMDLSAAQCLDQLRIYVYHCFYQLYFLRKQCGVGVVDTAGTTVLGWKSCRYGKDVYWSGGYNKDNLWKCKTEGQGNGNEHTQKCGISSDAGSTVARNSNLSPLMSFLCDALGSMVCERTRGMGVDKYPSIEDHMNSLSPAHPKGHLDKQHGHCPVPMGFQSGRGKEEHFKDLTKGSHKTEQLSPPASGSPGTYPAHCTGNTLSLLLEYYCDPEKCHGSLVLVLRLLACITPTVPRTMGDLFGFYYYIVYIGGYSSGAGGGKAVHDALGEFEKESKLYMLSIGGDEVVKVLEKYGKGCQKGTQGTLNCLYKCTNGAAGQCSQYLCPLSGQQYGQLSPLMAGTYLSWLVYLIEKFETGLKGLKEEFMKVDCKGDGCKDGPAGAVGCDVNGQCRQGTHGDSCTGSNGGVCQCASVVSCTGVLPVLYKYGFGYGSVTELHKGTTGQYKKCHEFLGTLESVLKGNHLKNGSSSGLHHEINKLIYTTRLPWIFVLTMAWLVAVLYLAFGAIWPLDWTHMRSHCRGWFRKGSLSPWEILMVGKKKGRGILEFFGGR